MSLRRHLRNFRRLAGYDSGFQETRDLTALIAEGQKLIDERKEAVAAADAIREEQAHG